MNKGTALRLGGFVAAVGTSAALIAAASGTTGAYFSDTHSGTMQATSGHLLLTISGSSTALDFTDLMPGVNQQKNISYTTDSSPNAREDIWLVFPVTTSVQQLAYAEFTGAKGEFGYADGGLGRYGHFAVANNGNVAFTSYNLANDPSPSSSDCPVDANGRGGSNQQATSPTDTPPYCGVPKAILLASNLPTGTNGTINVTFGLTGRQTQQNQTEFLGPVPWTNPVKYAPSPVQFNIVATQSGVRPDAANF